MKYLIVIAASLACAAALRCKTNDDCSKSQCCVENTRWLIASKRRVVEGSDIDGGTCVDYILENGDCHYPAFTSCGCIPGTKFKYYPDSNFKDRPGGVSKRGPPLFRPGTSKCETPES